MTTPLTAAAHAAFHERMIEQVRRQRDQRERFRRWSLSALFLAAWIGYWMGAFRLAFWMAER